MGWMQDARAARGQYPLRRGGQESLRPELAIFAILLADGQTLRAEDGRARDRPRGQSAQTRARPARVDEVQYQLDDPKEFRDETILVFGAGDAAIENALALSEQNDVCIVNRGKEFSRAKDGNLSACWPPSAIGSAAWIASTRPASRRSRAASPAHRRWR